VFEAVKEEHAYAVAGVGSLALAFFDLVHSFVVAFAAVVGSLAPVFFDFLRSLVVAFVAVD